MEIEIDRDSPLPPSHQLAGGIRYRIAVGILGPGEELPSLREAADALGIHYHTVRKAYKKLEADGLVASERGRGTVVTAARRGGAPGAKLREFVRRVTREGWEEHALPPKSLAGIIERHGSLEGVLGTVTADRHADPGRDSPGRPYVFIECNRPQARDYAAQLEEATGRQVEPWLLGRDDPPEGRLVATYFHYNDVRERWPHRARETSFVSVTLDPELRSRLEAVAPADEGPTRIRLCEVDEGRAHNVVPDLATLLPDDRLRIERAVVEDPSRPLAGSDPSPVLYAPRLWARLDDAERVDDRSMLLRYVIRPGDLARLALASVSSPRGETV